MSADLNKVNSQLKSSLACEQHEPLWKRVPTRDQQGKPLTDFMMLLPRLAKMTSQERKSLLDTLIMTLSRYQDVVVFVDLNVKINLLWVSVRSVKGITLEIPAAIIQAIPEARLIADRPPA